MKTKLKTIDGNFKDVDVLVASSEIKKSSKGSDYLQLEITDGNSTVIARKWDCDETYKSLKKGIVVSISGRSQVWNNSISFILDSIEPSQLGPNAFFKEGPRDLSVLTNFFNGLHLESSTSNLSVLTNYTIHKYQDLFFSAPAAVKMHHNYLHGLAQHTMEVVELAIELAESRIKLTEEKLDIELVICGAILHDIGKCLCYALEDGLPVMTDLGKFKDHLVVGSQILNEEAVALRMNTREKWFLKLDHLILAHHGKLEYGSPVAPCFPEALIVYLADQSSAKLSMIKESMDNIDGDWGTKRDFIFGSYLYSGEEYLNSDLQ